MTALSYLENPPRPFSNIFHSRGMIDRDVLGAEKQLRV
jgi:hypothetical protein